MKSAESATSPAKLLSTTRHEELRRALEARRREIEMSVRSCLLSVREERATADRVGALDDGEVSDVDIQEDIELVLVQMKVETLERIDAALVRLAAGQYGHCIECGDEIAAARLRALPFAVRCLECEDAREADSRRRRHLERACRSSAEAACVHSSPLP